MERFQQGITNAAEAVQALHDAASNALRDGVRLGLRYMREEAEQALNALPAIAPYAEGERQAWRKVMLLCDEALLKFGGGL